MESFPNIAFWVWGSVLLEEVSGKYFGMPWGLEHSSSIWSQWHLIQFLTYLYLLGYFVGSLVLKSSEFFFFFLIFIFIYLAALGLSCNTWDLWSSLWHADSYLHHVGSSFLTGDRTWAPPYWGLGVLATEPPGKILNSFFSFLYHPLPSC